VCAIPTLSTPTPTPILSPRLLYPVLVFSLLQAGYEDGAVRIWRDVYHSDDEHVSEPITTGHNVCSAFLGLPDIVETNARGKLIVNMTFVNRHVI
jgi:hypothetical protein